MDKLKKLDYSRPTEKKTSKDTAPVYQSDVNTVIDKVNDIIDLGKSEGTAISFEELSSGNLIVGQLYKITDFRTKHVIPNTSDIHIADVEVILVTAISPTAIHPIVKSLTYPDDIIYFDSTDTLCEDGTTPRNGWITYREDVNGNSTYYDFRGVVYRRWTVDAVDWVSEEVCVRNTVRKYNDVLYLRLRDTIYDFDGTITPDLSDDWMKWIDLSNSTYIIYKQYTSNNIFGGALVTGLTFPLHKDFYTFTDSDGLENSTAFTNVKIAKHTTLNNIIIIESTSTSNMSFDVGCYNFTIEGGNKNLTFGKNTHDFYIKGSNDSLSLGNSNSYSIIGSSNRGISIGNLNSFIIGDTNNSISIGNNNYIITMLDSNSVVSFGNGHNMTRWRTLGSGNQSITFFDHSFDVKLNHENIAVTFATGCIDIVLGSYNGNMEFIGSSTGTFWGDANAGNIIHGSALNGDINSDAVVIMGDSNIYNVFESGAGLTDIDLSTATHLKGAYTCHVFSRLDGVAKLSYIDNSGVLTIVDVTA